MKPYYAQYVSHCCRFYFNNPLKNEFENEVERKDFRAVEQALKTISEEDRNYLKKIYTNKGFIKTIRYLSSIYRKEKNYFWKLVVGFERKVAIERKLL